jgi:hypothetical protein
MQRHRGRRTCTTPFGAIPESVLADLTHEIAERLKVDREAVRWTGDEWQYRRCGEWVGVPWYVYPVDAARRPG